jgi:hypothetical protein
MSLVDFFIVGAPKCGTTSLATYLGKHTGVFFSKNKEPYFFCTDFPKRRCEQTLEQYHAVNFDNFSQDNKLYGEGSTFYLYSNNAISNIKEYNSNAKIIVMLRNPVDLIHSLFEFRKYGASEVNADLATVWSLNEIRKRGAMLPQNWHYDVELLYYDEIAAFGTQLERVYKYFDYSSVKVIIFDDFKNATKEVYMDVLSFLGLEYDGKTVFEKENTGKHNKLNAFRQVMRRYFYDEAQWVKGKFGIDSFEPLFMKLGLVRAGKESRLSEELRTTIRAHYKPELKKLEILIDRNLEQWYYD